MHHFNLIEETTIDGIVYQCAAHVSDALIYEAFQVGFSDYVIKLQMDQETFFDRFFGPEGNTRELSFVALDGSMPVGVVLSGIRSYDGILTMRCGTLCIHPEYRGRQISQQLMSMHYASAKANHCKQLMLEVIAGNDRAIKFYETQGYDKVHFIHYYNLKDVQQFLENSAIKNHLNLGITIQPIPGEALATRVLNWDQQIHTNWQNSFDYTLQIDTVKYYAAYLGETIIGFISGSKSGKIYKLCVHPEHRNQGIGTHLLSYVIKTLALEQIFISVAGNAPLTLFLREQGFAKDDLYQFEMIRTI